MLQLVKKKRRKKAVSSATELSLHLNIALIWECKMKYHAVVFLLNEITVP